MNLSHIQRRLAWIALGAGVVVMVWGVMGTPDSGSAYKTSPGIEHQRAASKMNTR